MCNVEQILTYKKKINANLIVQKKASNCPDPKIMYEKQSLSILQIC